MSDDLHEHFTRDEGHAGGSDRNFGFVFATVCGVIAAITFWNNHTVWRYWLIAGVAFLTPALIWPRALHPLNVLWTRFGLVLHKVMQPVIMGLLFSVAIVPMGLLLRALGKDPLRRRIDSAARSYWIVREPPGPRSDSFKNQF